MIILCQSPGTFYCPSVILFRLYFLTTKSYNTSMKTFEKQTTDLAESEEDISQKAFELQSSALKSLENIQNSLNIVRRHAEKINESSTKTFVGSFLSDINGIRSSYETVKAYFENISKLKKVRNGSEFDPAPESGTVENNSPGKRGEEKERKTDDAGAKQQIRWDILEATSDINGKIDAAKHSIKYISKRSNGDGILEETYNCLKNLDTAMAKLNNVEKDIEEYSQE